jgi:hypothetical protein
MSAPPFAFAEAQFRHPWRPYQARVLAALDRHLADRRLHVIAPPGSGKTVLGLETLRRLARPALVLSPTVTIREQWIQRLEEDFPTAGTPPTLSRDALQPAELTFITYQGLYQLFHREQAAALLEALRAAGVAVIAADEAHHLRNEWWRCLDALQAALPDASTLSLTATPPYDAPQAEWRRYTGFAGEVDEEIGVPELVREGSLCPHQDLLLLFPPDPEPARDLQQFEARMASVPAILSLDTALVEHLACLPELCHPEQHLQTLTQDAQFWLAVAVLLGNTRWEATRPLLTALGLDGFPLPSFDLRWAEILLRGLLIDSLGELPSEQAEPLRSWLREHGGLHRRTLALREHPRQQRLLASATGMIDCVAQIVDAEYQNFGAALRLVVLTDHVRSEAFAPQPGDPVKLGVVPIFERLRQLQLPGVIPAILTGTLVVLPVSAWPAFERSLRQTGAVQDVAASTPLPHAPDYLRFALTSGLRQRVVAILTELFTEGDINLLCGTSALLGEGWDAPAINSLVLASGVAAHVSSNQLRGRAIRARRGHPHKCSNLWHLACVQQEEQAPADVAAHTHRPATAPASMAERFRGFVGLRGDEDCLESGLQRMGACAARMSPAAIDTWNRRMFGLAAEVHRLDRRWQRAIGSDRLDRGRQMRELRVPSGQFAQAHQWRIGTGFAGLLEPGLKRLARHLPLEPLLRYLLRRRIRALAWAVATAMIRSEQLPANCRPQVTQDGEACRVSLPDVDYLQAQRFIASLAELFDPLADPRYLVRSGESLFAVPASFGLRREDAEGFLAAWVQRAGAAELVYTRSSDGRLALLRAKEALLMHMPDWQLEQRMVWISGART